jgi:hypothetical protein
LTKTSNSLVHLVFSNSNLFISFLKYSTFLCKYGNSLVLASFSTFITSPSVILCSSTILCNFRSDGRESFFLHITHLRSQYSRYVACTSSARISNAITTSTGFLPSENNLKACGGIQNTVYWTNDVGCYTSLPYPRSYIKFISAYSVTNGSL